MRTVLVLLVLLAIAACTSRAAAASGAVRHVVIETDLAADDAMAILFLLGRRDVDVRAIAVDGAGEAHCPVGATNARALVRVAGKRGIPIGCGRPRPLRGTHAFPDAWRRSVDDFYGLPRPAMPEGGLPAPAAQVLTSAIESTPGRVDVLTLGPPTELAAALETTYIDPHALNVVFRSGPPVTLVPLDATRFVPMTIDVANRLGRSRSASFVRQLIERTAPLGAVYFWDPLAAAVVVDPKVAAYADKRLAAIEREGPQSGRVVERKAGAWVRTAISAKRPRFEQTFASTLR